MSPPRPESIGDFDDQAKALLVEAGLAEETPDPGVTAPDEPTPGSDREDAWEELGYKRGPLSQNELEQAEAIAVESRRNDTRIPPAQQAIAAQRIAEMREELGDIEPSTSEPIHTGNVSRSNRAAALERLPEARDAMQDETVAGQGQNTG